MREKLLLGVLMSTLLVAAACSASLPQGESGVIIMAPFTDDDYGIRGVVPQNLPDRFALVQQSFPGTRDELTPILLAQTNLKEIPERVGSVKGVAFTWDLYAFETRIEDVMPENVRVDMALAEGDSVSYIVALVTLPDEYDANAPMFDTIFTHVVYALAPLE